MYSFMVSSRRFFEGRGWFINGIPKKEKQEKGKKKVSGMLIEDFMEDIKTYKKKKRQNNLKDMLSTIASPAEALKEIRKRESEDCPPVVGISIAYIDDFIRKPNFGIKRCARLLDFIMIGLKNKMIHPEFDILVEEKREKLSDADKFDHLWKGREHTPQYKMAMEIKKLNEKLPKTRFDVKRRKPITLDIENRKNRKI